MYLNVDVYEASSPYPASPLPILPSSCCLASDVPPMFPRSGSTTRIWVMPSHSYCHCSFCSIQPIYTLSSCPGQDNFIRLIFCKPLWQSYSITISFTFTHMTKFLRQKLTILTTRIVLSISRKPVFVVLDNKSKGNIIHIFTSLNWIYWIMSVTAEIKCTPVCWLKIFYFYLPNIFCNKTFLVEKISRRICSIYSCLL